MRHIISILVENKFGVLARIAGMFSGRGFNIESLAVGPTETEGISRITMVLPGDDRTIEQLIKQLYKLPNVIRVQDITKLPCIERELVLMENVMKYSTRTSHLEIQYPTVDTKSKLEYKDLDNSWSSITIKHGHKQVLQTEDDFYK